MSYSDDASGQTISLPSEDEIADEWNSRHDKCLACEGEICIDNDDGTNNCLCFDNGPRVDGGAVHADCREKFTMDCMAHDIEQRLRKGLPLGMEPWALDQSRNLAMMLYHEYVNPKKGK